jgi:peptide/nickel transport system substrate-binding protein
MKRMRLAAVAVVAAALALTACTGPTHSPTANGGTTPGTNTNTTFVYDAHSTAVTSWDPSTSYSNEVIVLSNVYETLTRYDDKTQTVKPLLATSWKSSDDGMTWTFTLRPGMKFHSGNPLDAPAAKAAIERTIKLNAGASYIWGAVKTIDAPDATTLVFNLSYPAPLGLISSADYAAYIFDTKAAGSEDLKKWLEAGHDAGSGPYSVTNWQQGQEVEVTLDAFPDYWGGWDGGHYKKVVYRVVPQATTAAQLLRGQEVNFVAQLTPELWGSFKGDNSVQLPERASWQNLFAFYNTTEGPLKNANLRKAVSYGINYDGIIAALKGAATRTPGIVPKGLVGYSENLAQFTHDPDQAKQLLAKEGYGPGKKALNLSLTYTSGDAEQELAMTLMKSSLADLNVTLSLKALQWPTQWAQAQSGDVTKRQDIFVMYWWPDYADPYSWFINLFHSEDKPFYNLGYYSNPALDKQIDQVEAVLAVDKPKAEQMYIEMQKELFADAPAIVLYTSNYQRAMLSSVKGYTDNPAYPNVTFAYDLHPAAQ